MEWKPFIGQVFRCSGGGSGPRRLWTLDFGHSPPLPIYHSRLPAADLAPGGPDGIDRERTDPGGAADGVQLQGALLVRRDDSHGHVDPAVVPEDLQGRP